jgi:hypothetical protein
MLIAIPCSFFFELVLPSVVAAPTELCLPRAVQMADEANKSYKPKRGKPASSLNNMLKVVRGADI